MKTIEMQCGLPGWTTGEACVGVMQIGKQSEEEVRKRIEDAGKRWRHRAVVQHKLELAKAIGSIAIRWKLIPGDEPGWRICWTHRYSRCYNGREVYTCMQGLEAWA